MSVSDVFVFFCFSVLVIVGFPDAVIDCGLCVVCGGFSIFTLGGGITFTLVGELLLFPPLRGELASSDIVAIFSNA